MGQQVMEGDPKFNASQELPDFPYARYAELIGLRGICIDQPEEIGNAWDRAFDAGRPVILEVYTDPNVPPLPPHITFKQTKVYLSAILKGDPDSVSFIKASLKQLFA
jgi:pyruvate dehydrogenase (quinone)